MVGTDPTSSPASTISDSRYLTWSSRMLQLSLDSLYKLDRLIAFRKVDHVCCWIRNALGDWSSFFTSTRLLCKLGMSLQQRKQHKQEKIRA